MNLEIGAEKNGMRLTAVILTNSLETHSALQEVPKSKVEQIKEKIQVHLDELAELASNHRKRT